MGSRLLRLLLLLPVAASGCAALGPPVAPVDGRYVAAGAEATSCARFFGRLDRAVHQAGVADAEAARLDGFPYLRVSRFLAAGWRPSPDDGRFESWARRLLALDRQAREVEIANLPADSRAGIDPEADDAEALATRVKDCGESLLVYDLSSAEARRLISERAAVPDAYRLGYRLAGLYPITSILFYAGVKHLQDEIRRDFVVPLESIPVRGRLVRYRYPSPAVPAPGEVSRILERASDNPLGLPDPDPGDRARLFSVFAPVLEIDVAGPADRVGRPVFDGSGVARVDVGAPVVYTRISHVRFETQTMLQLNYVLWFPERPKKSAVDILAGHLDGITWRVTLDADGIPLLFDSMHNCGCYHLFLPTAKLRPREGRKGFEEPLLSPQRLTWRGGRSVLRIASRSHYLQRVYFETDGFSDGVEYELEDYSALRSLPDADGGRKSLFGADALVRGSERPERWLFWPMGVPSAGAMRQWGHHATAFVGRRHFDDPDLIGRYFERVPRP